MPRLTILPTLLREVAFPRTLPREPEPDLVMADAEQVAAYTEAGRIDGVMAASYLFNSACATEAIRGSGTVVDLGCGPATQLAQIAQFNPDAQFHGIDLSPTMLESAQEHVRSLGLSNVRFTRGDITALEFIAAGSVDAVISTVTLHHLPTFDQLRACFREIRRILRPGGAIYIVDFARLKHLKSVLFFAYMNAKAQPHIFSLDYERSLRAAFLFEEFVQLCAEELPGDARVTATFLSPFLTVISTKPRPLPPELREKIRAMRLALPRRYRADLDDIRLFMRLGGMRSDPFR